MIEFIADFIITNSASSGPLTATVSKIDDAIRKLPSKSPLNMYRKKFGDMDQCLKQPGISSVFQVEGNNVKFHSQKDITTAYNNRVLSEVSYKKYLKAQTDAKSNAKTGV